MSDKPNGFWLIAASAGLAGALVFFLATFLLAVSFALLPQDDTTRVIHAADIAAQAGAFGTGVVIGLYGGFSLRLTHTVREVE